MKQPATSIFSILVLTFFIYNSTFAQTKDLPRVENELARISSKLRTFIQQDDDSVGFYSSQFENRITRLVRNNPSTLMYPFKKLRDSNSCIITTSLDGDFRIYSWDTWTGGTMHVFHQIYQWRSNGKVFVDIVRYGEGVAGTFCSKIYSVNINEKLYYLVVQNGIFSTKDAMQSISAYTIDGNNLNDTVRLFKTKTKRLNEIQVNFDFFSVVDRPERPLELITYNDKEKIIYIPVVDQHEQVTNKSMLYQLKGGYFEYIGIEKAK
jgi:hypothetical protein